VILDPRIWLLAAGAIGGALVGHYATALYYRAQIAEMRQDAAMAAESAQRHNRVIETLHLEIAGITAERDAARHQKIRTVEREVTRDVIKYVAKKVPVPVAGECRLDDDWVYIHDKAAAGGGVPQAPEATGGADGGAAYAEALEVVTDNYGACQHIRAQLISFQEWARALQEVQ